MKLKAAILGLLVASASALAHTNVSQFAASGGITFVSKRNAYSGKTFTINLRRRFLPSRHADA